MEAFMAALDAANAIVWADAVLYIVLGVGILFTFWSGFGQYRALTHGFQVIRGKYDDSDDPGAINHFQALSAALSATVGLGNIGGVAIAIGLGGPGAVFWMWMIGLAGMALKTSEVTLSMIYRNTDDPKNPHGGPMYVADRGFAERGWPRLGKTVGVIFCGTLMVSVVTGGNMFQAWNVAAVTHAYFGVPQLLTGVVLAVLTGAVILGGIERIGEVAGRLVPFMCLIYIGAAFFVIGVNITEVPRCFGLIISSAFSTSEGQGAFIGGTAGYAFLWGMKRALFSSEAGQGSSPIAHAAARTSEPVREAVVAGLEPFIDTIVVCTITAMVILTSGVWNRPADIPFATAPRVLASDDGKWTLETRPFTPPDGESWADGDQVFAVVGGVEAADTNGRLKIPGTLQASGGGSFMVAWSSVDASVTAGATQPAVMEGGAFFSYPGATLTAKAFDATADGLGMWLVSLAAWLFAISTMISWSYYGEQGIIYLFGDRAVAPYRVAYCLLIIVATIPWLMRTDAELDTFTSLGTGVMLWSNVPIMVIFGGVAMRAYKRYMADLDAGKFD